MMKAGVPLLQSFDIVAKGTDNQSVAKLFNDIKNDVETGTSLSQAFRKYPLYFDALFCNLVAAGEQAGILDDLLDRLATYKEKIQAIKGKIKKALFYPAAVIVVAAIVVTVIMLFVVPAFKEVFENFGANLPAPTMFVIAMSDVFPPMVLQMTAIGEESGSLEHMLGKAAEIIEEEVDEMVKGLSSLIEPMIIVFLGTLIGGIVVSMYLPIFKLGQVV